MKKISSQGHLSLMLIITLSIFTVYTNFLTLCVSCYYSPSFFTGYTLYISLFLPLVYVSKYNSRFRSQGPGDRHSLLLSAGDCNSERQSRYFCGGKSSAPRLSFIYLPQIFRLKYSHSENLQICFVILV